MSVPLLLKKISEDLAYLKASMDIVRENPQFMAYEFLSSSLQNLNNNNFDEVRIKYFLLRLSIESFTRHIRILKKLTMRQQREYTCHLHLKDYWDVYR